MLKVLSQWQPNSRRCELSGETKKGSYPLHKRARPPPCSCARAARGHVPHSAYGKLGYYAEPSWKANQPQELSVWRKQANLSVQEEFTGKTLPPDLEDSLPKTLSELSDTVRSGVRRSAETYINLCTMMERLTRRNEGMAAEYVRFSQALGSLTEISQETYAVDTNDVPLLNEGLNSTARHLDQSRQLLEDEARGWEEGVLEDLKRQRDTLVSVRDMFDRRDKYAKDNIPALERRIANNETKLQTIRNKPADLIKPGEAEKVEDAISKVRPTTHVPIRH